MKSAYVGLILMVLFLSVYIFSNFIGLGIISGVLSPVVVLMATLVIILGLKDKKTYKTNWLLLAMVGVVWSLADTIWILMAYYTQHPPENSLFLLYLYAIPNMLIMLASLNYFRMNLIKWHKLQLTVDVLFTTIVTLLILTSSLLQKIDFSLFDFHEIFANLIYIVTSMVTFVVVVIVVTSSGIHQITKTMKVLSVGYFAYIFTDLAYVYQYFLGTYTPNALIDSLYVCAIASFAIASIMGSIEEKQGVFAKINASPIKPFRTSHRVILLIWVPLFMMVMKLLDVIILIIAIALMSIYDVMCRYIQIAIRNEKLLEKEKSINLNLEAIVEDKTKELLKSNQKLQMMTETDLLTGMKNRRYFINKIDALIDASPSAFSVFYMDLNNFKAINDTHGHEMGDKVLHEIAKRLLSWQTNERLVARVGGDEFAIIYLKDLSNASDLMEETCQELIKIINKRILIDSYVFKVGVSLGVSRFPMDANSRELMMKHADLAMYQAKNTLLENSWKYYSAQEGALVERRNKIEILLKTISYEDEFELYYQPQVSTTDQELVGVEALLRWHSSELGKVGPSEFIQIAEETDTINKIGNWVTRKAFAQIKEWNMRYDKDLKIGINLSPLQLDNVNFFSFVQDQMRSLGINPKWIDFEITETSTFTSGTIMEEVFTALSNLGVQISIDDFGTGYSSLSYIKRYDIDRLKIAKELIDHIVMNSEERVIIKAIILMAKGMGLQTIAEGVETEEQMALLKDLECEAVQGYLISHPLPAEAFEKNFLTKREITV